MLTKPVEARGKNWDRLLALVLLVYRNTPDLSSGKTPFFLMYGRDFQLPTGLNFLPTVRAPTIYIIELFADLKVARQLAKQNIGKAQVTQKTIL